MTTKPTTAINAATKTEATPAQPSATTTKKPTAKKTPALA